SDRAALGGPCPGRGLIDRHPRPIERELDDRGAVLGECLAERRLEVRVALDMDATGPEASRDRSEVDRAELRADTLATPPAGLPHVDRAVALVVEHQDDD